MMIKKLVAVSLAVGIATASFAGGHGGNPAVDARQAHMKLYGFNLGILGGMARGNAEYDAEMASAAAANMAALVKLNQSAYWPMGSDNASIEGTRALPALWENFGDVMKISGDFVAAAENLAAVAGNGLEALQGAIGPVGGACGACHKAYRAP